MTKDKFLETKILLDFHVNFRNNEFELSNKAHPDPVQIASIYKDEYISLVCALFAYGNAKAIVKFLKSIDFALLDSKEDEIKKELKFHKYRFQTSIDIIEFFKTLRRMKLEFSLNNIFLQGYNKENNVMHGINEIINAMDKINPYKSRGYSFLISKIFQKNTLSTYKRWNMYLRWMVRNDYIDMGLWNKIQSKDLLIPLDTHTRKIALKLGLMDRKTYDFKAVLQLTNNLKKFDKDDPIKYDFALYRIGQSNFINKINTSPPTTAI